MGEKNQTSFVNSASFPRISWISEILASGPIAFAGSIASKTDLILFASTVLGADARFAPLFWTCCLFWQPNHRNFNYIFFCKERQWNGQLTRLLVTLITLQIILLESSVKWIYIQGHSGLWWNIRVRCWSLDSIWWLRTIHLEQHACQRGKCERMQQKGRTTSSIKQRKTSRNRKAKDTHTETHKENDSVFVDGEQAWSDPTLSVLWYAFGNRREDIVGIRNYSQVYFPENRPGTEQILSWELVWQLNPTQPI